MAYVRISKKFETLLNELEELIIDFDKSPDENLTNLALIITDYMTKNLTYGIATEVLEKRMQSVIIKIKEKEKDDETNNDK